MVSFTQPDPTTKPPLVAGVPLNPLPAVIQWIALDKIAESPFNPRTDFPAEGLAELAASIAARGLLEPLVVRPGKKPGQFELMAGHRRLRALQLNKAEGCQCNVIEADDGAARATLIVENLQREDLGPMEEAAAFHALHQQDPKVWSVAAIATAVGKTSRFVQQRIAIAGGLSAPLKKKFADGEISVEVARTLAPLPKAIQAEIPAWAVESGDAGRIRREAFERCIPEAAAKFEIALYKGEWIEDDKKRRYFFDTAQFMTLQRPAAEKKLAEVQKDWPKAELITADAAASWYWADQDYVYHSSAITTSQREGDKPARYVVPKEKCHAVVWIAGNGQVRKALGVCKAGAIQAVTSQRNASRSSSSRMQSPAGEPAANRTARGEFNAAFAKAWPKAKDMVGRLQLMQWVGVRGLDDALVKLLPTALRGCQYRQWQQKDKDRAKIWTAIATLTAAEIQQTLTRLALAEVPRWESHQWRKPPPVMAAIAETIGVAVPKIGSPAKKNAARKGASAKVAAAKKKHQ